MSIVCQNCGLPMPPLPDDLTAILNRGVAVEVVHDVCPTDAPAVPEERHFEVRVQIVEVEIVNAGESPAQETLAEFRAGVRADNLPSAMRPLAEALGQEWMKAEKHAGIADGILG